VPWKPESSYVAGSTIRIRTKITAHHYGHMELRGCATEPYTQACFDANPFLLVKDLSLYSMPADPAYPERGYYAGAAFGPDYVMEFKVPEQLVGSRVLLQWKYITANSCMPPNYKAYFNGANSESKVLPADFWNPVIGDCLPPYPNDGSRSSVWPEQFFNCAEGKI